jgi:hypothetical protein
VELTGEAARRVAEDNETIPASDAGKEFDTDAIARIEALVASAKRPVLLTKPSPVADL